MSSDISGRGEITLVRDCGSFVMLPFEDALSEVWHSEDMTRLFLRVLLDMPSLGLSFKIVVFPKYSVLELLSWDRIVE